MSSFVKIFEVIRYINENITEELSVEQCSKMSDMSVPYFIEKFKRILGYSPYKYIKKKRLELSTKSLLKHNRIIDIALDNGYESNEAYTRAFLQEFGMLPSVYRKNGIKCTVEELSDIEKIVAFLPAPRHKEYSGDLYYIEHKEIYDSVLSKGFFDESTLDYRIEAKQLTEKYSYEYSQIILSMMKISSTLSEVYSKVTKIKPLPILLFYSFVKELADNGMLNSSCFKEYEVCAKCKFLLATLYDANFIREQLMQEYKERGFKLSIDEIYCLGLSSEKCVFKYCPLRGETDD